MAATQHPNATIPDSVEVPRVGALGYELGFPTPETRLSRPSWNFVTAVPV